MLFLPPNQQCQSTEGKLGNKEIPFSDALGAIIQLCRHEVILTSELFCHVTQ